MSNDTGESKASIDKRYDMQVWPNIQSALRGGATLRIDRRINRAVLEGLHENDPRLRRGRTMSLAGVRRKEEDGEIVLCGVDRYMVADRKELP